MKAYLDTNILRQLNKIPNKNNIELICSQLGIMELIAGMTSEKEYNIRKTSLINILNGKVKIVWESVGTLQSKAFGLVCNDYDVPATKLLMEQIIKTDTLPEAKDIKVELGGEVYSIETLTNYDNMLVEKSTSLFKQTMLTKKEDKEFIRNNPYTEAEIRVQTEMTLINFLDSLGIKKFRLGAEADPEKDFTPEYVNAINKYNQNKILDNYLKCLAVYILDAMKTGNQPGKNDIHDICHIAYCDHVDLFISNDKIYQRFPQYLLDVKFLTLDEFIMIAPQSEDKNNIP
ncbi:TPA: hypothetical protein NHT87_005110 [Klebsiella pneumoniae]|uniref:hypothetical protein n=1 Tax=Klebsiella pneumoniae complex TaxID=3390273 RepID=UPI000A390637|nr:hypothetical protein [Klebsiella pneumoniae]ELB5209087.1 hypothetical protein [Klebsiella pneumoniae]EMA2443829.1 hypothetical protein [Klebsiella pneumoniae]OUG58641.1 hypothetical protein AZZ86_004723 [Klebsiella pneumoniae]SXL10080.1 Uncharacterised protein [Klebsiella pneumoniae]VGF99561.1 Uncharacterised protein [Klebsiella pneumoniae]